MENDSDDGAQLITQTRPRQTTSTLSTRPNEESSTRPNGVSRFAKLHPAKRLLTSTLKISPRQCFRAFIHPWARGICKRVDLSGHCGLEACTQSPNGINSQIILFPSNAALLMFRVRPHSAREFTWRDVCVPSRCFFYLDHIGNVESAGKHYSSLLLGLA